MQGDLDPFVTLFAELTLTQGSWRAQVLCFIPALVARTLMR